MRGRKPSNLSGDDRALTAVPNPPSWFNAHAKSEWRRIMPLLVARKILTEADMGSVENYCVAIGQVRDMQALIDRDGHVVETTRGPRAHPAVKIQSDAMTRARLLAAELGLTPVSRSRPAIKDTPNDQDDASALGV
jgi:P27 family predicted phage terminase small subunit